MMSKEGISKSLMIEIDLKLIFYLKGRMVMGG